MEVKEFVKTILKEVTEAVAESNNEDASFDFLHDSRECIDFDLAVVTKRTEEGKIGAEVLGIGGKIQGSASNEIVNHIKFRVHPSLKKLYN